MIYGSVINERRIMETIEVNGDKYEVSGYAEDGLPIIKAHAESIQDGFDEDGNPKISVKINVPVADLLGTPGEIK